jgi:hypothetical protein
LSVSNPEAQAPFPRPAGPRLQRGHPIHSPPLPGLQALKRPINQAGGNMSHSSSLKRLRNLYVLGALLALPLEGCASGALGSAVELSTAGSQASTKLLQSAQTVETEFHSSVTSDRFLVALQNAGVPPGRRCSLITNQPLQPVGVSQPLNPDNVDKIATALRARTDLAQALGKSYSAMNALASYDARGAIEGGVADVFSATNSLRSAFGLAPVSDTIGSLVPVAAGALVQARQVARLKQASARLRLGLSYYKDALEHGKDPAVSLLKDGIEEKYALQIALWRRGYLDANGLLADSGSSSGLTVPGAENVRFTASDEALCLGVRAALEGKRDEEESAVESEYDTQIKVVDELIAAHQKFERGAPLDASHLAALLDQLTALAKKIGEKKNGS